MARRPRPMSPHLQVYRPQITSILSISHRMTGVALAAGSLILTGWLSAAIYGPDVFASAQALLGSFIGQLILWGLVFSVFYHLGNGIRHLAWDSGWGFELEKVKLSGMTVIAFAVVMTAITLMLAYS